MKNKTAYSLLFTFVLCLFTCGWLTGPNSHPLDGVLETRPENIVTFVARYEVGDEYCSRLVIADVENPENFKFLTGITGIEVLPYKPKFSPDKSKIVFGDIKRGGFDIGPPLVLYDMASGSQNRLGENIRGYRYIWNNDNTGFYYIRSNSWSVNILFYDYTSLVKQTIPTSNDYPESPVGFKDTDTLIVQSVYHEEEGRTSGYYYKNLQRNSLSYIDNPNLELINVGGIAQKAAWSLDYNDNIQMFVYAEISTGIEGYRISVTNLDGSYYHTYTTGEYIDDDPVWSANGRYIVFTRESTAIAKEKLPRKLYIIDTADGSLRELIDPAAIHGAVELFYADF